MRETLAEVTNRPEQWPDDRRWDPFGNSELSVYMKMALEDNPGLKVASVRLREPQGLVRVEGACLLPFLDAHVSPTYEGLSQHRVFPDSPGMRHSRCRMED